MELRESADEHAFRDEVRAWLEANLTGAFAGARGLGGPGREHEAFEIRAEWEKHLAAAGWTCLGWPVAYGGRGFPLRHQVIFHEEYARSDAPVRVGLIGEGMVGPTLLAFGTDEQRARLLPPIQRGEQLWCQLYSEPNAGSDLANISTKAVRDGEDYVLTGQKVWTSLAHWSDWGFAIVRTEAGSKRHRGLSYVLVPMREPGIELRPIIQATGTSEFNEVFFDGARTSVTNLVGSEGDGWKIGMATLGFERGSFTLGQQVGFRRELERIMELAKRTGAADDASIRDRLARAWIGVEIMRLNALRTLSGSGRELERTASIGKLYWSTWHQELGDLAMDVLGMDATVLSAATAEAPYELLAEQSLFLFSRSDTIYAGSSEVQRNIIAERSLGLPKEPTVG